MLPGATSRFYFSKLTNKLRFLHDPIGFQTAKWNSLNRFRNDVIHFLRKKFKKQIVSLKETGEARDRELPHERGNNIWIYWAQGIENAPDLVKVCVQSVVDRTGGGNYKVTLLSDANLSEYLSLPQFIIEKYQKGKIMRAHFSDLVRIALLNQYGGIWIDATILCTQNKIPDYMLQDKLFLFQTTCLESVSCITKIENYYIRAEQNNKILLFCQALLYEYYKKYDVAIEYWLFYDVFQIAIEAFPNDWKRVVHYPRADTLALSEIMFEPYDETRFEDMAQRYPFHKLSYKVPWKEGSVLDHLVKNYKKYGEQ